KRKQLMQLHVECEIVRRRSTPALHHSRLWHGIERRVYLDQFEMLRIPGQPLASRQFLRIPALHKAGVRPTGCADKNSSAHMSTKSRYREKQCVSTYSSGFSICRELMTQLFLSRGVEQSGSSSGS